MKLRLGPVTGVTLTDVTIDGSAAAGLCVGGAITSRSTGSGQNTRADAIHFTEVEPTMGTLTDATVRNPGDDGVAVWVSYMQLVARPPCRTSRSRIRSSTANRGAEGSPWSAAGTSHGTTSTPNTPNAATIYVSPRANTTSGGLKCDVRWRNDQLRERQRRSRSWRDHALTTARQAR